MGVLSLGVIGKTKCVAGGLIVSGLRGCTDFLNVDEHTRISPKCSGLWKEFITCCCFLWKCRVVTFPQEITICGNNLRYCLVTGVVCADPNCSVFRCGIRGCSGFVQKLVPVHSCGLNIGFFNQVVSIIPVLEVGCEI